MASSDRHLFGVATAFASKPRSAFGYDIVPSGEGLSSLLVLDNSKLFLFKNRQWQAGPTPN
eukprot:scaffold151453_cov24-Attheya_sp.AAC.1